MAKKLIVSACLCGKPCRYDGKSSESSTVTEFMATWTDEGGEITPVCPEELGELGTPRPPAELRGGVGADIWRANSKASVRRKVDDRDITSNFTRGAKMAASVAANATHALLKSRSPSCGVGSVWSDGAIVNGDGVFAALLRLNGITIYSDEEI